MGLHSFGVSGTLILSIIVALLSRPAYVIAAVEDSVRDHPSGPATKITIHQWPLSSPSPSPYLEAEYSFGTANGFTVPTNARFIKYIDKKSSERAELKGEELIRLGLLQDIEAGSTDSLSGWRGVLVNASTLRPVPNTPTPAIVLHFHETSDEPLMPYHLSVERHNYKDIATPDLIGNVPIEPSVDQPLVLVRVPQPLPPPHLAEPVTLDEEGNVPEKEPEKTLLQRYWWIFLVVALFAVGGGGGGE